MFSNSIRILSTALVLAASSATVSNEFTAWSKVEPHGEWTAASLKAVQSSRLAKQTPSDVGRFCPRYASLGEEDREKFWVALLSAVAKRESNFKPHEKYVEPDVLDKNGRHVVSRGLLQISMESANCKRYSCGVASEEQLHDPAANLSCGVRILDYWVGKDNVIAKYLGDEKPRGGGRYWNVLREKKDPNRNRIPDIAGFTGKTAFCRVE